MGLLFMMVFRLSLVVFGVLFMALTGCTQEKDSHTEEQIEAVLADEIRELTGAPTRIVWLQDTSDGSDYLARGDELRLMGLDTEVLPSARTLLDGHGNMAKPFFTANGDWVVFSDRYQQRVFLVNWEGGQLQNLGPGFGLTTWVDPKTGIEWLYVARDRLDDRRILPAYLSLWRFPLFSADGSFPGEYSDQTKKQEQLVWDQTQISEDSFQLSSDGRYASAAFPWPETGILDLESRRWDRLGQGCWVAMSPDNDYLFWIFDGPHRNVFMFRGDNREDRWTVNVNNAIGMDGYEVYHPKWSNHSRIIAVSGPYKVGEGSYRLPGGGAGVKIYLGRFNSERTEIEAWVQATDDSNADFYPDVWVQPHADLKVAKRDVVARKTKPQEPSWPLQRESLLYVWENAAGLHDITFEQTGSQYFFRPEPRLLARYTRHNAMHLDGGFFIDKSLGKHLQRFPPLDTFTLEFTAIPALAQNETDEAWVFAVESAGFPVLIASREGRWRVQALDADALLQPVVPGRPVHFALVYLPGEMKVYVDGGLACVLSVDIAPDIWLHAALLFGGDKAGGHDWQGSLEKFALYQGVLEAEKIAQQQALILHAHAQRPIPDTVLVRSRVVQTSSVPSPEDIAPYQRGLVVNEYEVIEVLEGQFSENRFLAAHWAILDETVLDAAYRAPGSERVLLLERFDERRELEGERLAQEIDNFLLELYIEMYL
jgi:hypothetical protein